MYTDLKPLEEECYIDMKNNKQQLFMLLHRWNAYSTDADCCKAAIKRALAVCGNGAPAFKIGFACLLIY